MLVPQRNIFLRRHFARGSNAMCNRVARQAAEWLPSVHAHNSCGMKPTWSYAFARRARLSTFAIASAVMLTLAAVISLTYAIDGTKRENTIVYGPSAEVARGGGR